MQITQVNIFQVARDLIPGQRTKISYAMEKLSLHIAITEAHALWSRAPQLLSPCSTTRESHMTR